MSAIFGVCGCEGRAATSEAIHRMDSAVATYGPHGAGSWSCDDAALGQRLWCFTPQDRQEIQACSADFLSAYEREYESRLRTRFRSNLPLAPAAQRHAPGMNTRVRLASSHALLIQEDESGFFFTLKDRRWTCDRESAPALAMLSHRKSIPVEHLTACVEDAKAIARLRMLLSAMAIAGVITLGSPESSASTTGAGAS